MNTTVEFSTPRRSARIFRKLKVQAQGRAHGGKKFRETCETLVVSAHGGLLMLKHEVDNGDLLVVTNPETQEEIECRIVYLGDLCDRGQRFSRDSLRHAHGCQSRRVAFLQPGNSPPEQQNSHQHSVKNRLANV